MTMLLLALGVIAGSPQTDPAAGIADPANRHAAMACEAALAGAAGGELKSIGVETARRTGSRVELSGEMRVFLRPAPPSPGELSPAHIINALMGYRCRLDGPKVVRATVFPIPN